MEKAKITIHVPKNILEQAKLYARENDTTLTKLITVYLGQLDSPIDPLSEAPVVSRLSGSLSQDVTIVDHRRHLEEKSG